MKPLALSVGCPSGIGPEIAVAACARFPNPVMLFGDRVQLLELAQAQGVSLERHEIIQPTDSLAPADRLPGKPTPRGGAAQFAWINAACDAVSRGEARALVTGPVSKSVIASSGDPACVSFRGHTEHLRDRLLANEVVMAFSSPKLTTTLVTTHLPLSKVPEAITPEAVACSTYWLGKLLVSLHGSSSHSPTSPIRVAVAGLNPHAGEGGLLGHEETTAIEPGMAIARDRLRLAGAGVELVGPMGAESAYRLAMAGEFAGVVAMYHDQGTIPLKLVGFGEAVNISLGLPVVRTSVDHGTAYDRAGQGNADESALLEALVMAERLANTDLCDKNVR
jgi:4-hydroxythreonine-4-phosphate dehydrogenase